MICFSIDIRMFKNYHVNEKNIGQSEMLYQMCLDDDNNTMQHVIDCLSDEIKRRCESIESLKSGKSNEPHIDIEREELEVQWYKYNHDTYVEMYESITGEGPNLKRKHYTMFGIPEPTSELPFVLKPTQRMFDSTLLFERINQYKKSIATTFRDDTPTPIEIEQQ